VLVIGGEPVPFCLARIPQGGEVRGNLAAGGKGVAQPLSERDREIAAAARPGCCAARGLLLVGLDIIGDSLTEINVTSPTCFQEIFDRTGCDAGSPVYHGADTRPRSLKVQAASARSGVATPSLNTRSSPGAIATQSSLVVSGSVATTITSRSFGRWSDQVNADVLVLQLHLGERVLAQHIVELGTGMGPQRLAVAQQEVEGAMTRNLRHQLAQASCVSSATLGTPACGLGQLLQQPAKGQFAVGAAHGA